MLTKPISFLIAERSGLFEWRYDYLRPLPNSGIAEYFNHTKCHNYQSYVLMANKPDSIALIVGGSKYTLSELATCLKVDLPALYEELNCLSFLSPAPSDSKSPLTKPKRTKSLSKSNLPLILTHN